MSVLQQSSVRLPRLFIASASENLGTAEALQIELDAQGVASTVWNRAFQLSRTNIENLELIATQVSGAVFVMGAEDIQIIRERRLSATRDNLLLELGLFAGKLGRTHCVVLRPALKEWRWPSDLDGVSTIELDLPAFRPVQVANQPDVVVVGDASREVTFAREVHRAACDLARHFLTVERQRWGQTRTNVGYFLRAIRDTYLNRFSSLSLTGSASPHFRLNLMTPAADQGLSIACVDYESDFHEKEFEKRWVEGEGKCGHAWKHCIQAIYGADLQIADAGLTEMRDEDLPEPARNRQSVISTPVFWHDTPVAVLNFDSAHPAAETLVHKDTVRECFLMAASRIGHLLHGTR